MDQIHQKNHIYIWLLISCTLLIVLIWVGGLTRLTGSGLSITQWEIFSGILPPFTDQQWSKYFSLYKQIPEYKKINYGMSLNEFKIIFWWEYIHRFLARFLVIIYFLPFIYFAITKQIKKNKITFFTVIFFLFLTQGFMGWYMVKSGLVSETDVSHFRLAAHLSLALIIYSMIFWSLLNVNFNMSLTFKTETTLIMCGVHGDEITPIKFCFDVIEYLENVTKGKVFTMNTKNSLIFGKKKLISTIGLDNILLVETKDAIFLAKKGQSQKVKELIEKLTQGE